MKKELKFKKSLIYKVLAIVGCALFVSGFIVGKYVEQFRGHPDLGWLYSDGKAFQMISFILSFVVLLVNSIAIINSPKEARQKHRKTLIVSLMPVLFFLLSLILSSIWVWVD